MRKLPKDWTIKNLKIKHLPIEIIDGDRSKRYPKRSEFQKTGVLFLNTANIAQNRLDITEANFVSLEKFNEIRKGRLQKLDIVITTRGSIGKVALFNLNPPEGLINAQMLILRADDKVIDPKFLFYQICGDDFQTKLRNFASGSAQPQIPIMDLKEIEIRVPALPTQGKIAAVLSAYDDLIENNTRRIKILEDMAHTLYQKWFVHFRFPGHENVPMVESPLGPIPHGWKVKRVKEIVKRLKAGKTYRETDVDQIGKVIVVDQSRSDFLGFHDNEPDHNASSGAPVVIFGDHTCKMQLMVVPFSLGPNVVPFIAKDKTSIEYLFFLISSLVETREYKRYWTELNNKVVAVADSKTSEQFSDFTTCIFQKTEILKQRNHNLQQTRDLLLPKLISGEIDVSELDIDTSGM